MSRAQEALQIEPGLKWYAIQTKPNRERDVEKRLTGLRLEVFLPWMRTRRRIGSRFQWVMVPLFPGYVFCRLDMVLVGQGRALFARRQGFFELRQPIGGSRRRHYSGVA